MCSTCVELQNMNDLFYLPSCFVQFYTSCCQWSDFGYNTFHLMSSVTCKNKIHKMYGNLFFPNFRITNQGVKWYVRPTRCNNYDLLIIHLLNMFQALLCPSSGALDRVHCVEDVVRLSQTTSSTQCTRPAFRLPKTPASTSSVENHMQ